MNAPDKRLKFFSWLMDKGIVIDDIEKMEETIKKYQEYLRQKAYAEKLEKVKQEDITDEKIKNNWEESKEEAIEAVQRPADDPQKDEGGFNIPWYDKDGFHER